MWQPTRTLEGPENTLKLPHQSFPKINAFQLSVGKRGIPELERLFYSADFRGAVDIEIDLRRFYVLTLDKLLKVYSTETFILLRTFEYTGPMGSTILSLGDYVFSSTSTSDMYIFEIKTGRIVFTSATAYPVDQMKLILDKLLLLYSNGILHVFDFETVIKYVGNKDPIDWKAASISTLNFSSVALVNVDEVIHIDDKTIICNSGNGPICLEA